LLDGSVKPEGIDLNYLALPVEEIFWRMLRFEDFDVAELSMGPFWLLLHRVGILSLPSPFFRRGPSATAWTWKSYSLRIP